MESRTVLSSILGLHPSDSVVVTLALWKQARQMMTRDGEFRFRQCCEGASGGEEEDWVVTDFMDSALDEWPAVVHTAHSLRLHTPAVAWTGNVECIPDDILLGNFPVMVRATDSPGWFNLRAMAQAICVGTA